MHHADVWATGLAILDQPGRVLEAIDRVLLGPFPPAVRLAVWGSMAGFASMALYARFSPQRRLRRARRAADRARRRLAAYDGEFDGLGPLALRSLALSWRVIALSLLPALLAGVPSLALIVWAGSAFSVRTPEPGDLVPVRITPADAAATWHPPDAAAFTSPGEWAVAWPLPAAPVVLRDAAGREVVSLPATRLASTLSRPTGWNRWFVGWSARLPAATPIDRIEIDLPPLDVLPRGPAWLRAWYTPFFLAMAAAAGAMKTALRIE